MTCSQNLSLALEKVQRQAALTVLGAYRKTKHTNLRDQLGWETLSTRRKCQKLTLFYKIIMGLVPNNLFTLIPQTVASSTPYGLRNQNDYREIPSRTVRFRKSFILSTINLWNKLGVESRTSPTLSSFKSKLKKDNYKVANKLFLYGTSHGAINHSRIRMGLSGLNQQRRKYNFIENGRCPTCHFKREDDFHYFTNCPTYATQRGVMYREICQTLAPNIDPNLFMPISNEDSKDFLSLIIHGSNESDYDTNKIIFNIIHKFITNTKRFI